MKILILILISLSACMIQNKKALKPDFSSLSAQHILVYKTKFNYNNLVPVLLSNDKTEIISYPNPRDLIVGSGYSLPTILNNDYLLDNRGIGINVAFLKLTYEEYSELKEAPSMKELYSYILDKSPLQELCDCGNKNVFSDIEKELNIIIDKNQIRITCKPLK